ncbi:T9SS type A sorting domain-containing protein [Tenacibaculum xiamenense]|uniref:T9SS type A sorting domain-containing protein n=1 Tax=Tenacibaculum xiamenense TaxID=1261553 RepID=UPI0038967E4B
MKKTITFLLLLVAPFSFYGQVQSNTPWMKNDQQRSSNSFKNMLETAEQYFEAIDKDKKGSGYKPFKRWEDNLSKYLRSDGTVAPPEDLWNAWRAKRNMSNRSPNNNGNWQPLGPYDNSNTFGSRTFKRTGQGRVNAIAVDPNNSDVYYVGSPAGGLWKSSDAGLNWTPLTDYLPQIGVSGIAIHPTNSDIIYISTGDDDADDSYCVGIWKSVDGGSTWQNTGDVPGTPNSANEIYINPNSPETVLVATSTGVQKTTDGGTNWTTKLSGNIIDLKMKPGDSNTWYALSSEKFYKSTDGGENFVEKTIPGLTGSGRMTMDVTIANANYIYIVSAKTRSSNYAFNGIYKSTDSGESFTKTAETRDIFDSTQAWFDLALTVSSTNADIVYVGVLDIWKSINGGNSFGRINSWNVFDGPSYTHADIHFLRFIDGKFFAGTDGGIFVSTNEGVTFTDLTKNIAISQFYKISISQQKLHTIAGGLQDNGGFGLTDDKWYNYHGGDGMEGTVDINNPGIFYGFMQYGNTLFVSQDGGKTLSYSVAAPSDETGPNDNGGEWITPMAMNSSGELFAGFGKFYKLNNRSWEKVSDFSFGGDLDNIEIDPNDDNFILTSRDSNLYISLDKGNTFTFIPFFFGGGIVSSIEISNTDSNTIWVTTTPNPVAPSTPSRVYKCTNIKDSNRVFTDITGNLPSESKHVIKHYERSGNNTVYLGTNLGVYYINDDLTEWQTFDNGLPNTQVRDLEINIEEAKLYAATYGRGIFVSDIPRQLPQNDVKLISIQAPLDGTVTTSKSITPKLIIKNQGTDVITNATIKYSYDNGNLITENWTGSLSSEQTTEVTLPSENLSLGKHSLNITVEITDDAFSSNNSSEASFLVNELNETPTTVNSFENDNDMLLTENSMWELGSVNKTLLQTPSGSKAYSTKLTGNHPDNTTGYLYTKYYNLSNVINPILRFKMGFDIEQEFDYMVVEYSTDKGLSWDILGTANDPNWYNSNRTTTPQNNPLPGKQWTGEGEDVNSLGGTNATNHDYSYDLASLQSETEIVFRFAFHADTNTSEEGAVIDDLVIEGTLSSGDIQLLDNVLVSPNPSEGIFNVRWKSEGANMDFSIYDITGKTILTKKNISDNNFNIDLSNFTKGIYLLNLKTNNKVATKKLVLN